MRIFYTTTFSLLRLQLKSLIRKNSSIYWLIILLEILAKRVFSAYLFSCTYMCNISLEFICYKMCQKTLSQFSAERLKGEKDELLVGGSLFKYFSNPFPDDTYNAVGGYIISM